ncbi:16631_t:CDS:2 [Funneliformis geosporum]|uniref:16631_t:CDS:1 n=1 Tax=Funneliformis geosporum TaxID=1117311 RepID=A0A9W4SV20_9GLOM|nr:16631_t:CDS:2 [Funneliformis geosporum]
MQYANGGDLQTYLKNKFNGLTWDDKKKLTYQIADGLNYLHNENILHRDLGTREKTIPGTPKDYELLYKRCWRQEPERRPSIEEVLDEFSKMNFGTKSPSVKDLYVEFDTEIADNHNNSTSESQFINFLENH